MTPEIEVQRGQTDSSKDRNRKWGRIWTLTGPQINVCVRVSSQSLTTAEIIAWDLWSCLSCSYATIPIMACHFYYKKSVFSDSADAPTWCFKRMRERPSFTTGCVRTPPVFEHVCFTHTYIHVDHSRCNTEFSRTAGQHVVGKSTRLVPIHFCRAHWLASLHLSVSTRRNRT